MTIKVTYNVTDVYMSQSVSPVYINVSYSDGGASGGGVWGSITGTLSNQTDLQNALNLKVPYTGATTNVNLGEYELKAGQVTLDTSPTGTAAVGTIRWNDSTGTSETTLKGGNVIIKNGVDLVARVVNKVSPNTTLTKAAYQAVRVSGAQGQRLAIELAQANNDAGSADTIGLVTETIAANQEGFIMTVGQLEGINTTGSLQGETWVDGDVLYLSPTTAGAVTNVKPTAVTGHIVVIGYVEYAHVNNGKIYVKVMNGWELDELHNVSIVTPTNNQGLFYNSTSTLWENKTISTALGYTPVPTTRNITINGVTYDLSADRTYTISTGISGSGAAGQVTYWTGANTVSGSADLIYNNTNKSLQLSNSTNSGSTRGLYLTQTTADGAGNLFVFQKSRGGVITSGTTIAVLDAEGFDGTAYQKSARISFTSSGTISSGIVPGTISFVTANSSGVLTGRTTINESGLLSNNGNFQNLGNAFLGFATDQGVRLSVSGDTLLRGSGATSATTALTVQNSSSTNLFTVRNDGNVKIGNTVYNDSSSQLTVGVTGTTARGSIASDFTFQDFQFVNTSVASGNINGWSFGQRRNTSFGNTIGSFQIVGAYIDNTGVYNSVGGGYRVPLICNPNGDVLINGGNANVVNGLIGLKVNAPTAHVDITASTTAYASLRIRSGTAPTSPNDGDIWFDGTNIQMRIGGVTKTFTLI